MTVFCRGHLLTLGLRALSADGSQGVWVLFAGLVALHTVIRVTVELCVNSSTYQTEPVVIIENCGDDGLLCKMRDT